MLAKANSKNCKAGRDWTASLKQQLSRIVSVLQHTFVSLCAARSSTKLCRYYSNTRVAMCTIVSF